jgi:DNA (cytosine-5)-methyltransferase 1
VANPKKILQTLDLFSGAGGLALGFEEAGFSTLAGVDIDRSSLETFSHNFPDAKAMEEDLSKPSKSFLVYLEGLRGQVDVIVGGPPCQGFSIAGKRLIDDPRNLLYKNYIDAVKIVRPKYVVIENVPTIQTLGDGKIAQSIVADLKKLDYLTKVETINAADFGVPQNRRRTFFIAKHLGDPVGFPNATHLDRRITTEEAIGDLPEIENIFDEMPLSYAVKPLNAYQKLMRRKSEFIHNHWSVRHTEKTKDIISLVPDGGNYKDLPVELQETRRVNIAWTRMRSSAPSFTIDAGHNHHFHYKANRVPSVRECARIQSFPDSFIFLGNKTSKYRQVGNAVPPLLAQVLATAILLDLS